MSAMRRALIIGLLTLCCCSTYTIAAQQQAMTRELLLFIEVPTVVTAAGREQPLTQAPSAITVITAEDIRQSGATNIPDLLRVVPGLDFFRTSASNVSIAARGLNVGQVSARMQVLVDGLSVYEDVLGLIYWHQIPIPLEEIERIEIVRSPATALYGDKAFAGVVHIITKSPEVIQGTQISVTGGEADTWIMNLIHAGVKDKLSYKVSGGYDRTNQFPNPDVGRTTSQLGRLDQRGHFQVNYRLAEQSKVSLSGGIDEFDRREVLAPGFRQEVVSGGVGFAKANYELGNFKSQLSYNRLDADLKAADFVEDTFAVVDVYQAQLRHALSVARNNVLTGGASYRYAVLNSPGLIGGREEQEVFTVFLQDEWNLRDDLIATMGVGVDMHSEAGIRASPRGSLVYSPWQNHTFRAAIAKAYRNPPFLENFQALSVRVAPGLPQTVTVFGNTNLKPEEMLSYEVGYQTLLFERLRLRLELFYNELDELFGLQPVFATVRPGATPVQTGIQRVNLDQGQIYGGEIEFDVFITPWLRGFANYSYQEHKGLVTGPASRHKVNAGLTSTFTKGMSATVLLHHVGEPETNLPGIRPYTLVNLRLGYCFKLFERDAEVAVQAFNLFDDVHREFPRGDLIERRVSGTLRYRF